LICPTCQLPMSPHGTVASSGSPRFRCRNDVCKDYGKTSVERTLPKSADVLRQCEAVFPGLKWELLKSDGNRVQLWAKTKHFTVEVLVLREIGVKCCLVERPMGKNIEVHRAEGKNGQPVKEALVELRKKIEEYGEEIQEVLGEE
jgi:hypothetical protein